MGLDWPGTQPGAGFWELLGTGAHRQPDSHPHSYADQHSPQNANSHGDLASHANTQPDGDFQPDAGRRDFDPYAPADRDRVSSKRGRGGD